MLRKIRITLAVICFVLVTWLFLDFTGVAHAWFGWLAKIQFLPAVLALNLLVVLALVVLTLVFGRIYCSVICPLGVFQDVVAWIGKKCRPKKQRKMPYTYSPAKSWLRYAVLALFVLALLAGAGSLAALVAPYSAYGRMASNLLQPLYRLGNNLLAAVAEHYHSYAFYAVDVWVKSLSTLLIAVATFLVIGVLAWRNGRTYCNTICPVGTVLGFLSRFSLFRIRFDADKCKSCSMCSRNCKASCIDFKTHTVDYSRCVACGNCLDKCNFDALHYTAAMPTLADAFPKKKETKKKEEKKDTAKAEAAEPDATLRAFLATLTMGAATTWVKAQTNEVDGGLAEIQDKKVPARRRHVTPPGSLSARHMASHCTGCQLCVSACPNGVLRPSGGLLTLMQPEMSFERGACRPECTRCSEVCPTGAIRPITREEKSSLQVGHAEWIQENCIPVTDGVTCGNCARHCPVGAITMVSLGDDESSPKVPAVNVERCIGCGTCEYLCPARPFSAIYVEGHDTHRMV